MKVLIVDNYDSFTYNLYQLVGETLEEQGKPFVLDVFRNDVISLRQIQSRKYNRIILSPGPGDPGDKKYFGVGSEILLKLGQKTKVLGVCLGMQGLAHYYGGWVIMAKLPMHGKTSKITHDGQGVFSGLPEGLEVMRYHSLVVDEKHLPHTLVVTAKTSSRGLNEIMGLRHIKYPLEGVQFHPESFATEFGKAIIKNFIL